LNVFYYSFFIARIIRIINIQTIPGYEERGEKERKVIWAPIDYRVGGVDGRV
jgi:hypothetical protein